MGAALASALLAPDAFSAAGPQGIRPGHNITVFHNIDMVGTFGQGVGQTTQVDVFRGAHHVGTARGPAVFTGDGGAVEVNHGPAGAPQPGDCFEGATPDVRPGDRILVTNPGGDAGVDEAIVDDITILSRQTVPRDAATGGPPVVGQPTRQEVWVQGEAFFMTPAGTRGLAIDPAFLDSAGFIDLPADNQLRLGPNEVVAGPTEGSYIAKYYDADPAVNGQGFNLERNRTGRSDSSIFSAIAAGVDGHAMGYGHVVPLPPVAMLVDGLDEQTTAALGCEGSPKADSSAATTSVRELNIANAGPAVAGADVVLSVGGFAENAVTAADVELSDGTTTVANPVTLGAGAGQHGWTATFTKDDLAGLTEGDLTARLSIGGATKTVPYDLTPPSFAVSLAEGTHVGPQVVAVTGASDPVTYRLDGAASKQYSGNLIALGVGSHTLVVRSVDAVGNATERTLRYDVQPAPASPAAPGGGDAPAAAGLAAVAAVEAPQVAASARTPPGPVATLLTQPRRISSAAARRAGLRVRFTAPDGSKSGSFAVYRQTRSGLTLVRRSSRRVKPGANDVKLNAPALRRKLGAGLYLVGITLSGADGRSGDTTELFVRVLR